MWPSEGMRVEVKGVEDGFLGSWFGARILKTFKGECKVQYEEFVDENDESKPLQETVSDWQLRPVPRQDWIKSADQRGEFVWQIHTPLTVCLLPS
jgi:hypothetical protein